MNHSSAVNTVEDRLKCCGNLRVSTLTNENRLEVRAGDKMLTRQNSRRCSLWLSGRSLRICSLLVGIVGSHLLTLSSFTFKRSFYLILLSIITAENQRKCFCCRVLSLTDEPLGHFLVWWKPENFSFLSCWSQTMSYKLIFLLIYLFTISPLHLSYLSSFSLCTSSIPSLCFFINFPYYWMLCVNNPDGGATAAQNIE